MRICIVNQSDIPDADVQHAIRAINAQLVDVAYHWSTLAQLRLEGRRYHRSISLKELRGDAIIYISDRPSLDAAGWHEADQYGVPYGVVYVDDHWTVTLSHEVLETLLDPHCNRLCRGPHPAAYYDVFHWMELCDAVQANTYTIGGIEVSDWLLPGYFTPEEEKGMRISYLGADIESFGVAPGGYIGFFDPEEGKHDTYSLGASGEQAAAKSRRAAKYKKHPA